MKPERNDPCPCGSGKKYKKCCMAKDQAAAPSYIPAPMPPGGASAALPQEDSPAEPITPPEPLPTEPEDSELRPVDECWNAFEKADPDERIAIFTRALEEPWMDADLAAEMTFILYADARERNQLARFDELIHLLRQRQPKLYKQEPGTYLELLIASAQMTGRRPALEQLVDELAHVGAEHIEPFARVLERLEYHGDLQLTLRARRTAWPAVRKSRDILDWAINDFSRGGIFAEFCTWLDEHPDSDGRDPELLKRIALFDGPDVEAVASVVGWLSGRTLTPWTLADFNLSGPAGKKPRLEDEDEDPDDEDAPRGHSPAQQHLADIGYEFIAYAHHQEAIPWLRADMAREHLVTLIYDWQRGELKGHGARESRPSRNFLCPPAAPLEAYVARLVGSLTPQHYGPAAMVLLFPTWLRFLRSRGLLDAALEKGLLAEMAYLPGQLATLLRKSSDDPALTQDLERWDQLAHRP